MPLPGWWGKIAGLGDFASRRLPQGFIARWDQWLQPAIAHARAAFDRRWVSTWTTAPIWHFVALEPWADAAASGRPQAHAGLLMPSVDRVGRYFPLCIAQPLAALPGGLGGWQHLVAWLDQLDGVALQTLDERRGAESLDAALAALGPIEAFESRAQRVDPDVAAWCAGLSSADFPGASLWWSGHGPDALRHRMRGLPDPGTFVAMLR